MCLEVLIVDAYEFYIEDQSLALIVEALLFEALKNHVLIFLQIRTQIILGEALVIPI